MSAELDREKSFADALDQIAFLPANRRVDALLETLVSIIASTDARTICSLRDQIMERFATCGCSFDTCRLMIEFINGHLALRELEAGSEIGNGA